jgi:DNA mismatch endonuclease (patch repair protein)
MPDIVTPAVRSRIMQAVRSFNTSPERALGRWMRKLGVFGWKAQVSSLPGTPDFALSAQKLAIFLDGCFWHGCLHCYRAPKSHKPYWRAKLRSNRLRDIHANAALARLGWKVVRLWEHEVRERPKDCVSLILRAANRKSLPSEPMRLRPCRHAVSQKS